METRAGRWRKRASNRAIGPQVAFLDAIRAELPEDGIFVDEVTQLGFAVRLAFPVFKPRTFPVARLPGQSRLGFATALGAQRRAARRAGGLDLRRRRLPCSPPTRWRPRSATAFRAHRSCSPTAPSAMSAASSRSVREPADRRATSPTRILSNSAESFGVTADRAATPDGARAGAATGLRPPRRPDLDRRSGRSSFPRPGRSSSPGQSRWAINLSG